eukprot:1040164-Prymnesium_polylepis.2
MCKCVCMHNRDNTFRTVRPEQPRFVSVTRLDSKEVVVNQIRSHQKRSSHTRRTLRGKACSSGS